MLASEKAKKAQTYANVRSMFIHLISNEVWTKAELLAFKLEVDRCWLKCKDIKIIEKALNNSDNFYIDNRVGHHGKTAKKGWRSSTAPSLQVIVHQEATLYYLEMDIDRYGTYDLVSIFGHTAGVLYHRIAKKTTNAFKIAKVLKKKGYPIRSIKGVINKSESRS